MRQPLIMHCPRCGGNLFRVYQEFDDQNHRVTIRAECPDDGTVIYADSIVELSVRFPEGDYPARN